MVISACNLAALICIERHYLTPPTEMSLVKFNHLPGLKNLELSCFITDPTYKAVCDRPLTISVKWCPSVPAGIPTW